MSNELKTSEEWMKTGLLRGSEILDPDGWDRQNYQFSWFEEKITEKEFMRRALDSSGMWTREFLMEKVGLV
jgi:hypothetical protein